MLSINPSESPLKVEKQETAKQMKMRQPEIIDQRSIRKSKSNVNLKKKPEPRNLE